MIILNKRRSQTPLEAINEYRTQHPDLHGVKLGYAGRLDPMAEGVLLLLVDEENKNKAAYENLDKEYEFELLCGISTDTYDLMGIITNEDPLESTDINIHDIQRVLSTMAGTWSQQYPPYSSATVDGHPLFWWTRQGRLGEITIPTRVITISSIEVVSTSRIHISRVAESAITYVNAVEGDFRQLEIIQQWQTVLTSYPGVQLTLAKCRVVCSTGTYVRSICQQVGHILGTHALAYSIRRTRIGDFTLPVAQM